MRTNDKQIGKLINKLTTLSANKNNNEDDGNANQHKRGSKRGRGGCGGKDDEKAKPPSYNLLFKKVDGRKPRIDWKSIRRNGNWDWWHVAAWDRSKMCNEELAKWQTQYAAWKKSRRCSEKCEKGEEGTNLSRKES